MTKKNREINMWPPRSLYFILDWVENDPLSMVYEPLCRGSGSSLNTPKFLKCRKSAQDTTAVQKHTILQPED